MQYCFTYQYLHMLNRNLSEIKTVSRSLRFSYKFGFTVINTIFNQTD
jgi:hypothetical protein